MAVVALVQSGAVLYTVDLSAGTSTTLTLPTGVTLATTRKPRFATLNQWTVMVNSPDKNLSIDPEGTVRPLIPRAPLHGPTLAAGGSTGLTGAYKYRTSFIITNSDGELLTESPLSPPSNSVTLSNQDGSCTDVPTSVDTISARRIYRTLSGGSAYFHLMDLDGNTSTSFVDAIVDATVELLPAQPSILTLAPASLPGVRFKNIVQWKSRLWAVTDEPSQVDTVYFSETNKVYAWPNTLTAYPTGQDKEGVVAFAPRRNQLGLLKRNGVWQVSGTSSGTGISSANLSVSQIAFDKAGCVAPDTVVVINDRAYWLGKDGVYEWSENGVNNITNATVAPWFKTDTYFERPRFPNAFAKYNEVKQTYDLHLAALNASTENRWVSLNLKNMRWYGPHLTGLFTPTHAAHLFDADGLPMALVGGSNGTLYTANSANFRDGAATAIDFDCYTPFFSADAPDIMHVWQELSVLSKVEAAGTLTITPYVGGLDASAGTAISHTLTTGRERLRRLGAGRLFSLRLRENTNNQGVSVFGIECNFFEAGRR